MEEVGKGKFLDSERLRQLMPDEGAEQDIQPSGSRGGIITARGTGDGVVIRLDGRVDRDSLRAAVIEFLDARKAFLSGHEVALEWVGARPDDSIVADLSSLLREEFSINVKSSKLRESPGRESSRAQSAAFSLVDEPEPPRASARQAVSPAPAPGRSLSLFDGMEALGEHAADPAAGRGRAGLSGDSSFWDDPDARIVYSTLRSGQKVETDHSLVVFGDVNSGAEIIAGGDIIVLGTLRGVAHAGAYDETGGGRIIFALNLQATQLRIGMVISRGSSESQKVAEIARVESGLIVVEPYIVKNLGNRRRD